MSEPHPNARRYFHGAHYTSEDIRVLRTRRDGVDIAVAPIQGSVKRRILAMMQPPIFRANRTDVTPLRSRPDSPTATDLNGVHVLGDKVEVGDCSPGNWPVGAKLYQVICDGLGRLWRYDPDARTYELIFSPIVPQP